MDEYRISGFELGHLIVIFILLGCALFLIYWLWVYPCNGHKEREEGGDALTSPAPATSGRVVSPPEYTPHYGATSERRGDEMVLYAMEIEPGTVVLQNQKGDMFRILREYDAVSQQGASTSCQLPPTTSIPVHYIPAYTRAHVQQTRASAPPYTEFAQTTPPDQTAWRPLCIQGPSDY